MTNGTSPKNGFLDIPQSIRMRIYRLFQERDILVRYNIDHCRAVRESSGGRQFRNLLLTCRAIRSEITWVIHAHLILIVRIVPREFGGRAWEQLRRDVPVHHIRTLHLQMAGNENVFSTFRAAMSVFDWGSNLKVLKLGIYNSDEPKYVTLTGQSKVANAWSKRKEEAFRAMLYLWPLIKLESKVEISFHDEDDGDHEMKQSFFGKRS